MGTFFSEVKQKSLKINGRVFNLHVGLSTRDRVNTVTGRVGVT